MELDPNKTNSIKYHLQSNPTAMTLSKKNNNNNNNNYNFCLKLYSQYGFFYRVVLCFCFIATYTYS